MARLAPTEIKEHLYMSRVPSCCSLQTMEEHLRIMLCWGIVVGRIKTEKDCEGCDLRERDEVK